MGMYDRIMGGDDAYAAAGRLTVRDMEPGPFQAEFLGFAVRDWEFPLSDTQKVDGVIVQPSYKDLESGRVWEGKAFFLPAFSLLGELLPSLPHKGRNGRAAVEISLGQLSSLAKAILGSDATGTPMDIVAVNEIVEGNNVVVVFGTVNVDKGGYKQEYINESDIQPLDAPATEPADAAS